MGKHILSCGAAFFVVSHILVTDVIEIFISGSADSIATSIRHSDTTFDLMCSENKCLDKFLNIYLSIYISFFHHTTTTTTIKIKV